jgi:hypothetical protein
MFWFGLVSKPWFWFRLSLFWFQNPQTKTKTMEQGLVWFGFGLNHGLPTFCHKEVQAQIDFFFDCMLLQYSSRNSTVWWLPIRDTCSWLAEVRSHKPISGHQPHQSIPRLS